MLSYTTAVLGRVAVDLVGRDSDPPPAIAMDAKIEFRNRSGVIARTIREDDAAVEAEAGSNDVLPGGKRPASCSVDDYFKASLDTGP